MPNPWGKVVERSGLIFEYFCLKIVLNRPTKKYFFLADFALQNMVETTLPHGIRDLWSKGVLLILAYL